MNFVQQMLRPRDNVSPQNRTNQMLILRNENESLILVKRSACSSLNGISRTRDLL